MAYETLDVEQSGSVSIIRMARPDSLNAMTDGMKRELLEAFTAAQKDPAVRAIILTGEGRGFCSGQDLGDRKAVLGDDGPPSLGDNLRSLYNPVIIAMRTIEKPVIGAINGVAAGAGMSLALACDMRIASEKASFTEVFVKVGLVPDAGSSFFLPRLIGMGRAFELCMTGDKLDAPTALAIGLVNLVVPHERVIQESLALAERLAQAPTKAIGLMKRALNRSFEHSLEEQLDYEAHLQQIAGRTQDYREGLGAFLEKRTPAFSGQ